MSRIDEIRRLLKEADEALSAEERANALHPVVPIAVASNRVRDALTLLRSEPAAPPTHAVWDRLQRMAEGYFG